MNLRKVLAIGWLAVSILPILYFPISMFFASAAMRAGSFDVAFTAGTIAISLGWILTASYIIYMFKTPYVPKTKRGLWVVILLFVHVFAMPFFWFYYVWQPLQNPSQFLTEGGPERKSRVPLIIGLLFVLMMPITILGISYQEGRKIDYLARDFPMTDSDKRAIASKDISISQPQAIYATAWLQNSFTVSLTDNTVVFEPTFMRKILYPAFEVPVAAIHSCSRQCGGGRDYILILDAAKTQIDIEEAPDLMDWCWDNKIPILSSNARREWLYNGTELPDANELAAEMVSRDAFDEKAKRSCQGY